MPDVVPDVVPDAVLDPDVDDVEVLDALPDEVAPDVLMSLHLCVL